jgi:hypothetical protein
MMLVYGVTLPVEEPGGLGGPYLVVVWSALWRHDVGTSSTTATCSGTCATAEGMVYVFWHFRDVPCHIWSCSRRGMFVLVV